MRLGHFFRKGKRFRVPSQSVLRDRIRFAITVYLRVRGLNALLQPDTALAVRENFDLFLAESVDSIEERSKLIGIIRLREMECFAEFEKVYSDPYLRSAPLGNITLGYIADQLAARILQDVLAQREAAPNVAEKATTGGEKDVLVLDVAAPAAAAEK